jgi:hypothetical protein
LSRLKLGIDRFQRTVRSAVLSRTARLVTGITAGLVLLLLAGYAFYVWQSIPRQSREGQTWTNRELVEYLREQGVQFEARAEVVDDKEVEAVIVLARKEFLERVLSGQSLMHVFAGNRLSLDINQVFDDLEMVFVTRFHDPAKAEAAAKRARDDALVDPEVVWCWGRFVFLGDPDLLADIRAALSGKTVHGSRNRNLRS